MPPITIIVRHPKENPEKCSVLPLKGRPDVRFLGYSLRHMTALDGYIRLAAAGPPLSSADRDCGILLLDGSWRWADAMTPRRLAMCGRARSAGIGRPTRASRDRQPRHDRRLPTRGKRQRAALVRARQAAYTMDGCPCRARGRVVEWQTRGTQNAVSERACGFESHLGQFATP